MELEPPENVMDSILVSVKKMLGIEPDYEHFDPEIIININSVFMTLTQLGVGPPNGFSIINKDAVWNDFFLGRKDMDAAKTYMYLKVRLIFDPPSSSFVLDAAERQLREIEWRLNVNAERGDVNE